MGKTWLLWIYLIRFQFLQVMCNLKATEIRILTLFFQCFSAQPLKTVHKSSPEDCWPYLVHIVSTISTPDWTAISYSVNFVSSVLIDLEQPRFLFFRRCNMLQSFFFAKYRRLVVQSVYSNSDGVERCKICVIRVVCSKFEVLVCVTCPFTNTFKGKLVKLCCFPCSPMLKFHFSCPR